MTKLRYVQLQVLACPGIVKISKSRIVVDHDKDWRFNFFVRNFRGICDYWCLLGYGIGVREERVAYPALLEHFSRVGLLNTAQTDLGFLNLEASCKR
jgi:hypothetical protein